MTLETSYGRYHSVGFMGTDWNWVKGSLCDLRKLLNLSGSQCPPVGSGQSLLCQSWSSDPVPALLFFPQTAQPRLPCVSWVSPLRVEGKGEAGGFLPLSCPGNVSASGCLSSCWVPSRGSSFQQEALGRWALGTSLHPLCTSSLSGGKHWLVTNFLL